MDRGSLDQKTLIDHPTVSTLTEPSLHTVYCLVDHPVCSKGSWSIVSSKSNSELFQPVLEVSESSKSEMIELARTVGKCRTCSGGTVVNGFRVGVVGRIVDVTDQGLPIVNVLLLEHTSFLPSSQQEQVYCANKGELQPDQQEVNAITTSPTRRPIQTYQPSTPRPSLRPPTPNTSGPTQSPESNSPTPSTKLFSGTLSSIPSYTSSEQPSDVAESEHPSDQPSDIPSQTPMMLLTTDSSETPSQKPSILPISFSPTKKPHTAVPTFSPVRTTKHPATLIPTTLPTASPTTTPSFNTRPLSGSPTRSLKTTFPTYSPDTVAPSGRPVTSISVSEHPVTKSPSSSPSIIPTRESTGNTVTPSTVPITVIPSTRPMNQGSSTPGEEATTQPENKIVRVVPNLSSSDLASILQWIQQQVVATRSPVCWKDSYVRNRESVLPNTCQEGYEKIGSSCYPVCQEGFTRIGADCHQTCQGAFEESSKGELFCQKATSFVLESDATDCEEQVKTICEANGLLYYPSLNCVVPGNRVLLCGKRIEAGTPSALACPGGDILSTTGFCYEACKDGFYSSDSICWSDCSGARDCGDKCALQDVTCGEAATIFNANDVTKHAWNHVTEKDLRISSGREQWWTSLDLIQELEATASKRVAQALLEVVRQMISLDDTNSKEMMQWVTVQVDTQTNETLSSSTISETTTMGTINIWRALENYRRIFALDFSNQTSVSTNDDIDQLFTSTTAGFVKQAWAEVVLLQVTGRSIRFGDTRLSLAHNALQHMQPGIERPVCGVDSREMPCLSSIMNCGWQ